MRKVSELAYASIYFAVLALFLGYIARTIAAPYHIDPAIFMSIGLTMIIASIPFVMFTRLEVSCVFLAALGLALDEAGLFAAGGPAPSAVSLVLANAMLAGVIVCVRTKVETNAWRARARSHF